MSQAPWAKIQEALRVPVELRCIRVRVHGLVTVGFTGPAGRQIASLYNRCLRVSTGVKPKKQVARTVCGRADEAIRPRSD